MYTKCMKRLNPFPSVSILLPDDIVEDNDPSVASYWREGDSCPLQLSTFYRQHGSQISAMNRLSDRMATGGQWLMFNLPGQINGCEIAAAAINDDEGTSWVHIYLVWEWVAVHATVSGHGAPRSMSGHGTHYSVFVRLSCRQAPYW